MGVLASSKKKTKLMKQISKTNRKLSRIDVMSPKRDALNNEKDQLYHQFWECLHEFPPIVEVIKKHNYSEDELRFDSDRITQAGYCHYGWDDGWCQGEYMPLSILAFAPPLDYFLEKKNEIDKDDLNDYYELAMSTLAVLKAM